MHNTITFIISKNYGRSLSLSMPVWAFYVAAGATALVLVAMVAFSLLFLASYPRIEQIRQENQELRQQRDELRDELHSTSQKALEAKEKAFLARLKGPDGGQAEDDGDDLTNYLEEQYQPPIRVESLTTRVNGRTVEVAFRLKNYGDENNRGGFLYAIFENDQQEPPEFVASPSVHTNDDGFPQTYKSGIRFTRIRDVVTFRRKVRRGTNDQFFTHVTLYLFSVRGGLLVKERFPLDRSLFTQDHPVVRTQQASNI